MDHAPEPGNTGYGQLINRQSGKCLEVNGTDGKIDQWDCVPGATNELWRQAPNGDPNSALQVKSTGGYLGTSSTSGTVTDGTKLIVETTTNTSTGWIFTRQDQ